MTALGQEDLRTYQGHAHPGAGEPAGAHLEQI